MYCPRQRGVTPEEAGGQQYFYSDAPQLVPAPGVPEGPCCINHPETAFITLLFLTLFILNVERRKC